MADLNDDSLKRLLGDDPITTSISVRIRQDEQTLNNLERRFRSIKQEAEGIAKALKEAGIAANNLGVGAGRPGGARAGQVGSTPVAGGPITPTPVDRGQGVIGTIQAARQMYAGAGGGRAGIAAVAQGMGGAGAIAGFATQAMTAGLGMIDARVDRGRDYALSADRVTMLFQQMKGMSQQAIQDTYRQPLTQYKLGAGGINALLGLEAQTGLRASRQAAGVEALRVSSGFSVNSQQAANLLGQLASPETVNRMFMTTGASLITPGGGQQSVMDLMQQIVSRTGLANPAIARTAIAPGSITRSNLNFMGVTGEFQDQVIMYAQQNAAFRQKGGKGMYNPQDPKHQKLMGIDSNFAMQAEETDRLRTKREEEFYSRQADNYADLEKQTQRLIQVFAALEDKLSGVIGLRTSNRVSQTIGGGIGAFVGGAIGSLFPGAGTVIGAGVGSFVGTAIGTAIGDDVPIMTKSQLNTLSSTTSKTSTNYTSGAAISPYGAMPTANYKSTYTATTGATPTSALSALSALGGLGRSTGSGSRAGSEMAATKGLVARRKLEPLENRLTPAFVKEVRMAFTPVTFRGKATTLAELVQKKEFLNAHPDLQQAFINAALDARAEGKVIGLTSGFRSTQDQHNLFVSRYKPVGYETPYVYQGQYWDKKSPELADVAVPGAAWSNHEHGLAFDVEGDIDWLIANASKYGLENFAKVNNEPWHFQLAGLREQGSGGGLGYNERTGFAPPNIGYGQDDDQVIKNALSSVGLISKTWERNVNGSSKNIGIEFLPVQGNAFARPGSPTPNRKLTGSADSMERFLTQSTRSAPGIYDTSKTTNTAFNQESAAKMLYEAGFRGQDLVKMLAIMGRESGYDPSATRFTDQEESYGLFQHNMHPTLTSADRNRQSWGLSANTDLFDPMTNIRIAYEKYQWYQANGMDPFHGWGPYKGMDPMYGTGNFLQSSIETATRLGYFSGAYTGDYVPTTAKSPKGRSEERYGPMASPMGLAMMSPQGARSSGATVLQGGNTITVSPTINISNSGSGMDQDLEKMARKVAELLEREVNRTMIRRT